MNNNDSIYQNLNKGFDQISKENNEFILESQKVEFPFTKKLNGWDNLIKKNNNEFDNNLWSDFTEDSFLPNKDGFRSDEFTKEHVGKHILFNGCSVTYGQGLYTNETWSYLLHKLISEKENVSGYYNIGNPGKSIFDIVASTFKYINTYGNPNTIFLDLPDLNRFYAISSKNIQDLNKPMGPSQLFYLLNEHYRHTMSKNTSSASLLFFNTLLIYMYQYLMFLEIYCKNNKIDLYIFSYVEGTDAFLKKCDLDNYYETTDKNTLIKIEKQIFDYINNNPDDEFTMIARDGRHYGTAFHYVWANMLYDIYRRKNNVN
jgi:hypothetical protein